MDYKLEELINGAAGSHPVWDLLMRAVAQLAEPAFIALVAVWFAVGWFRNWRADRVGAVGAVIAATGALMVNQVVSHIWFRPRVSVSHPGTVHLLVRHSVDASFPSDHTAAAFAIAIVLLTVHRRLGMLAILATALVAYSRVYVGEHYPGDVAGGAVAGLVSGLAVLLLLRRLVEFAEIIAWQAGGMLRVRPRS
jgi:undecaprenyl-diphosphatase